MNDTNDYITGALSSRLAEFRTFLDFEGDTDEGPEDIGPLYDYGLEFTKATTDHRNETVTYVHVLSTGGPHEEFRVTFAAGPEVERVEFFATWGTDNVTEVLVGDQLDTARDFYDVFFGDMEVPEF